MVVLGLAFIISLILHRVLFDSQVEYISSRNNINSLRARYSARSSVELSLLRIRVFKEVQRALKGEKTQEAFFKPYADFIWRFPLAWPIPAPEDLPESDKKALQTTKQDSFLKAAYFTEITPEDGKIDINNLISPMDYLRNFTLDSLVNLLVIEGEKRELEIDSEEALKILLQVADWMDKDNVSQNGGDEDAIDPNNPPLNRSFLFVEEIKNVPEVTEEIYSILSPHVSVYGIKGININYATKPLLEAIGIYEGPAAFILSRTRVESPDYKPFSQTNEFCDFLWEQGGDLCQVLKERYNTLEMLQFNTPFHFLIKGLGNSKEAFSQVETLVYDANLGLWDYKQAVEVHNKQLSDTDENQNNLSSDDSTDSTSKPKNQKKEKMQYKSFSPLFIMYWKEDL